jgi:hypothetical protein
MGWNRKPEKVERIKDFDIDISGDDAWPSYFKFGGDKSGWHLVRNLHAMRTIDMRGLVRLLTERYPYFGKRGPREPTAPRREAIWVDIREPIFEPRTALEILQKKIERLRRERLEEKSEERLRRERLEEKSEERLEERLEEQNRVRIV